MTELTYPRNDYIQATLLENMEPVKDWETIRDTVWTQIFSPELGTCHQFDLGKSKNYKSLPLNGSYDIVFNTIGGYVYLVHEWNQLPDVSSVRMVDSLYGRNGYLLLGKRIISQPKPQLERLPCSEDDYQTCVNKFFHATLAEEPYKCKVSILFSGQHLRNIDNKGLEECSNNITKEVNFLEYSFNLVSISV